MFADDSPSCDTRGKISNLVIESGKVYERRKLEVNVVKSKVMMYGKDGICKVLRVLNGETLEQVKPSCLSVEIAVKRSMKAAVSE